MRKRKRHGWRRVINGVNISTFHRGALPLAAAVLDDLSSFKTTAAMGDSPPQFFPTRRAAPTTTGVQAVRLRPLLPQLADRPLFATALVLILGTMAGYALGRLPMRGKFPIMVALLMISVFPAIAVIAPLYLLLRTSAG